MSFQFDHATQLLSSKNLIAHLGCTGFSGFGGSALTQTVHDTRGRIHGTTRLLALHQVHENNLIMIESPHDLDRAVFSEEDSLHYYPISADAWFLSRDALVGSGLGFCIKTADCLPLLFFGAHWIALVHAGWRGLQNGIIAKTLRQFELKSDCPRYIAIGPCADPMLYQVGEEFLELFPKSTFRMPHGAVHLDMYAEACFQIQRMGVTAQIEKTTLHTMSDSRFYSHRRHAQLALEAGAATIQARNYSVVGFDSHR